VTAIDGREKKGADHAPADATRTPIRLALPDRWARRPGAVALEGATGDELSQARYRRRAIAGALQYAVGSLHVGSQGSGRGDMGGGRYGEGPVA
jgi:hypothetical protein